MVLGVRSLGPERPKSASKASRNRLVTLKLAVPSTKATLLFTLVAVALHGACSAARRQELPKLLVPEEINCEERSWNLKGQNWTDGDPSVPDAGICNWHSMDLRQSNESHSSCSHLLGIPKVAMLFLTMGKMRHKELWSLWLQQAAGRLPVDCLMSATCGERQSERLLQAARECMTAEPGDPEGQRLFSIYVHPPPGFQPYSQDSLFYGTEIADRINSSWGTFDLAQATELAYVSDYVVARKLMRAALEDSLNQRFMTISESCVPLHPPHVVYRQLMFTEKSRINACTTRENFPRDEYRWTWRLTEMTGGRLQMNMWRKSHQWLALTRKHARIVSADKDVAEAFAKHCYSGSDPDFGGWWRTCFPDEHYFSTLLAFHGLDEETDCMGELTHTYWCQDCSGDEKLHPKTYKAEEISAPLLRQLRQEEEGCDSMAALKAAQLYVPRFAELAAQQPTSKRQTDSFLMQSKCPLFARKFSDDSPAVVLHALFSMLLADEKRSVEQSYVMHWRQAAKEAAGTTVEGGAGGSKARDGNDAINSGNTQGESQAGLLNGESADSNRGNSTRLASRRQRRSRHNPT